MEIKFLTPFKVCYLVGLINFIISFIILIILSRTKCKSYLDFCKEGENIFDTYFFFNSDYIFILIFCFLISFLTGITKWLINFVLNKYTIYHSIILYQHNALFDAILIIIISGIRNINESSNALPYILGTSVFFEYILLYIYLELIEINCCGLIFLLKKFYNIIFFIYKNKLFI